MTDLEKEYNKFWKGIVENDDGSLNKEQVMKELSDFSVLIENLGTIYDRLSGGSASNPLIKTEAILEAYEANIETLTDNAYRDGHKDGYDTGTVADEK